MLTSLSNLFYRLSSGTTAALATGVYVAFMILVMAPQSQAMLELTDAWGAPDGHFFYTPTELYAHLDTWTSEGKQLYINFRLGLDPLWALAYTAFLITISSIAMRYALRTEDWRRLLNVPLIIPLLLDISENLLGIALVAAHPQQIPALALLTACITSAKWTTLALAHAIMLYALIAAANKKIKTCNVF